MLTPESCFSFQEAEQGTHCREVTVQESQASTFQSQGCTGQSCSPLTHSLGAKHGLGLSRNHREYFLAAEPKAGKDTVSSPEHRDVGLRDP